MKKYLRPLCVSFKVLNKKVWAANPDWFILNARPDKVFRLGMEDAQKWFDISLTENQEKKLWRDFKKENKELIFKTLRQNLVCPNSQFLHPNHVPHIIDGIYEHKLSTHCSGNKIPEGGLLGQHLCLNCVYLKKGENDG